MMQPPPRFLHRDSLAMCQRQRFALHLCSEAARKPRGTFRLQEAKALHAVARLPPPASYPCHDRRCLHSLRYEVPTKINVICSATSLLEISPVGRGVLFTLQLWAILTNTLEAPAASNLVESQLKNSSCGPEGRRWDLVVDAQISEAWSGPGHDRLPVQSSVTIIPLLSWSIQFSFSFLENKMLNYPV